MHITGLRYKIDGLGVSKGYRSTTGTGRLRNYQCLVGDAVDLRRAAAAISYALSGKQVGDISDVQLLLADDAGHIWTIERRGTSTRVLMNGDIIDPDDAPDLLAAALLEHDDLPAPSSSSSALVPRRQRIAIHGDGLVAAGDSEELTSGDKAPTLAELAQSCLKEIAQDCARALSREALVDPRLLVSLTTSLEAPFFQYRELSRQYHDYKAQAAGTAKSDAASAETLAQELTVMQAIEDAAEPLLTPGVNLKDLQEELAQIDEHIARLQTECGLNTRDAAPSLRLRLDGLTRPLEALCRLEAHARLGRALTAVRQAAEQRVEPLHRQYLQIAESNITVERQVLAELENCLGGLSARLHQTYLASMRSPEASAPEQALGNNSLRTWFDKFKAKQNESPRSGEGPSVRPHDADTEARISQELETARMAVEYAMKQLGEVEDRLVGAKSKHDGALARIDKQLEDLTKEHARLLQNWKEAAQAAGLPATANLDALVKVITRAGDLLALEHKRHEAETKLDLYTQAMSQTERLVMDWRRLTGSQKQAAMTTPQLLISEIQGILRYKDAKRKRHEQLRLSGNETIANAAVVGMLKQRRKQLGETWAAAFSKDGIELVGIDHEAWPDVFKKSQMVRALNLLCGEPEAPEVAPKLFAESDAHVVASLYTWVDTTIENRHKLALLAELEATRGSELRLILVADASLGPMLSSVGIALFQNVPMPSDTQEAQPMPAPRPAAPRASSPILRAPSHGESPATGGAPRQPLVHAQPIQPAASAPSAPQRPQATQVVDAMRISHSQMAAAPRGPTPPASANAAPVASAAMRQRTPTTQPPGQAGAGAPSAPAPQAKAKAPLQEAILTEKALRTLELLTGKKAP